VRLLKENAMSERIMNGTPQTIDRGVVHLYGRFTTTTSGTLSTTAITSAAQAGFTLTKTATKTGRYTVTLHKNYPAVLWADAKLIGADDTAFTDAKGVIVGLRDFDSGEGAGDGTFEIQFTKNTDRSDAEVQDGAIILVKIEVRNATL
jgi:hypothetical protein